jgi:hypothetical protein
MSEENNKTIIIGNAEIPIEIEKEYHRLEKKRPETNIFDIQQHDSEAIYIVKDTYIRGYDKDKAIMGYAYSHHIAEGKDKVIKVMIDMLNLWDIAEQKLKNEREAIEPHVKPRKQELEPIFFDDITMPDYEEKEYETD